MGKNCKNSFWRQVNFRKLKILNFLFQQLNRQLRAVAYSLQALWYKKMARIQKIKNAPTYILCISFRDQKIKNAPTYILCISFRDPQYCQLGRSKAYLLARELTQATDGPPKAFPFFHINRADF
jgi:hypothetical protein